MAKPKGPKQFKPHYVDFNDKEKIEYSAWIDERELDEYEIITGLIDFNVKVSISMDQNNGVYLVTLTPKDEKMAIHGNFYMFRHSDLLKALSISAFYFNEVLDKGAENSVIRGEYDW